MTVVCVDAGTTMVKAVAFDADGTAGDPVRRPLVVERGTGGTSEQDMHAVWAAVAGTIHDVAAELREPVTAIAITGQGDGCWLIDEQGRPTGPAVLWNDARAAGIVADWELNGVLERAFRVNGSQGFAGTTSAVLAWFARHEPQRLEVSHRALYCDGWLHSRLTGEFVVDASDAANPLLDIRSLAYDPTLLDLFGIESLARLLPPVVSGPDRIATLLDSVADDLGLPHGVPVVLAPFDIPATGVGIGAVAPQQAYTILGTTMSTGVVLDAPVTEGPPAGMTVPLDAGRTWVRAMAAMAGSDVITWARQLLGITDPNELSALARGSTPGANGLLIHPYLSPAGERAPMRAPAACGSILGASLEHTREDFARAVLEGLGFVVRDCLAAASDGVTELRVCGGGANSDTWCQIISDITGLALIRTADREVGARGALLVAAEVLGDVAGGEPRQDRIFEPDAHRAEIYAGVFGDFIATRAAQQTQWDGLRSLRSRLAR